jgi:hypothetical protein
MASDETLLGTFTAAFDEDFEVSAKGQLVLLRGDQCTTVLLGPVARDKLRELLDRAAMPGQPLPEAAPAYDPAIDNCANMPGCGDQRVLFTWFHSAAICCPRCYENLFGGTPEPGSVITIPAATPASGRADGEAPAAEAREHG